MEHTDRGNPNYEPHAVLIEILGDLEQARHKLNRARDRMIDSFLIDRPNYESIGESIEEALRRAEAAEEAVMRKVKE